MVVEGYVYYHMIDVDFINWAEPQICFYDPLYNFIDEVDVWYVDFFY